jgi:hypothetical protein
MSFFLFILVNAALFIRPAEIFPELLGLRIYEPLILACAVAAVTEVFAHLGRRSLDAQPITLCVFGLLFAILFTFLAHMELSKAAEKGFEFAKLVLYYLLLVSVVNTPARLRRFLFWLTIFCSVMTLLAVLRYHGVIDFKLPPPPPTIDPKTGLAKEHSNEAYVVETIWDAEKQQEVEINRLRGTGIFQDPNDTCLALVIALPLCVYWLTDRRGGAARLLWIGPLLLLLWALYHTQSRGGFLGFMAGLLTLFNARFGWRKSVALTLLTLPVVLVVFAGRMTNIEATAGTAQTRIELWSSALEIFREAPLLGIGMGEPDPRMDHVAHNSYLQCFMELGVVGGTLFVGAFYCALVVMWRVGSARLPAVSEEMERIRPYLLALVVGSAACMMSLSLSYLIPTYMVLGLAVVYVEAGTVRSPRPVLRCDGQLLGRLAAVSVSFLMVIYVFVRLTFRA